MGLARGVVSTFCQDGSRDKKRLTVVEAPDGRFGADAEPVIARATAARADKHGIVSL